MATRFQLVVDNPTTHRADNTARLDGAAGSWVPLTLKLTTPNSSTLTSNISTINGPSNGQEVNAGGGDLEWISEPVSADVTISGTITFNLWGDETSMSANVAINAVVDVIRATDFSIVQIVKTARTVELGTTMAVNNFTATPTSTVVNKGDRIRVRVFADDSASATMLSGFSWHFGYNGAAGTRDSYVEFTETFGVASAPSGSVFYLKSTNSDVSTASVDKLADMVNATMGGSGYVTNHAGGWMAPQQITDTSGGTVMDWFTNPLNSFTLGGMAKAVLSFSSAIARTSSAAIQIARVNNDGSSPSVWGIAFTDISTSTDGIGSIGGLDDVVDSDNYWIGGDDLVISNGQRLRFRLFLDDRCNSAQIAAVGRTSKLDGSSVQSITLPQTVTEQAVAAERAKQQVVNQAVMRAATRFQKLTRRRSGLFVPEGWETPIEVPA